jgi:multidrug efflux system outer membrane protein
VSRRRIGLAFVAVLVAAGCRAGPAYRRPAVPVPEAHRGDDAVSSATIADLAWWEVFGDDVLVQLLHEAVRGNPDLRVATARIAEARASVSEARSAFYPQVDAEVGAERSRPSAAGGSFTGGQTRSSLSIGLPASWEIDVWGRVARGTQAARARAAEQMDLRADVLRVLVGDVAQAYLELRDLDAELDVAQETVAAQQRTLVLFQRQFEGERGSRLEVERAAADRATAAATVPRIRLEIERKENQIALLLGRTPGSIPRGAALGAVPLPPAVPVGLPSELLERRPDVRAAEMALVAANADVGVAIADLFPRFSLTSFVGLASSELASLVSTDATGGSIGGSLLAPLVDGGARRSRVAGARARFEQARVGYVHSALRAFRDVADALAAIRHLEAVHREEGERVTALEEAVRIAWARYEEGLSAYFEVLEAQRALFPARIVHVRALRDRWIAVVQLYRALGGGWSPHGATVPAPVAWPEDASNASAVPPSPPPP